MSESDELKSLRDSKEYLQGLLLHPGWNILLDILKQDREAVLSTIFDRPLASQEGVYNQEFVKGRAFQIKCVAEMPQTFIDNLTRDIEIREEQERTDGDSTGDGTDADSSLNDYDGTR